MIKGAMILLLCSSVAYTQQDSSHFLLNDGTEMNAFIAKVEPWGCVLNDNRTVLFTVVRELRTPDSSVALSILEQVENVTAKQERGEYVLNFQDVKIRPAQASESPVTARAASISFAIDYRKEYCFQVDVSPSAYKSLLFSAGFSTGSTFSGSATTYGVYGGFGYAWDFPSTSLLFSVNYGTAVIQPEIVPSITQDAWLFKGEAHFDAVSDGTFIIMVGGYAFFQKEGFGENETFGGIKLGLGMKFFHPETN